MIDLTRKGAWLPFLWQTLRGGFLIWVPTGGSIGGRGRGWGASRKVKAMCVGIVLGSGGVCTAFELGLSKILSLDSGATVKAIF